MLKRLSGGQELDELVSTARNTFVNPGSVAPFTFITSIWGRISGCSYNLNVFKRSMSDTETLLPKIYSGLKIHTVFIRPNWAPFLTSIVLLLLGYLTTKSACSRQVHAQCYTSARASFLPWAWVHSIPTWKNRLCRARTRRSHSQSHNSQGSLPLDAVPSSREPPVNQCLPHPYFETRWKDKKLAKQNLQETAPAEENVNQLLKTTRNKWHFNRLLKHVQQSIIQPYLQKVTL